MHLQSKVGPKIFVKTHITGEQDTEQNLTQDDLRWEEWCLHGHKNFAHTFSASCLLMLDPLWCHGSLCRSSGPPTLAMLREERTPHMREGRLSHLNRLWGGGVWEPGEHSKLLNRASSSISLCPLTQGVMKGDAYLAEERGTETEDRSCSYNLTFEKGSSQIWRTKKELKNIVT